MNNNEKEVKNSNNKNNNNNIDLNQYYEIDSKLGEGNFSSVYLSTHILTKERVAIKVLEKSKIQNNSDKIRIEREINVLKKLHHYNIINLYSTIENNSKTYIIQEYIPGKNLFEYIKVRKKLDEKESCEIFQQIIFCLEYIHKLNISHRDLKPENILLTKEKKIKLIDFGLSNIYNSNNNNLLSTPCGSPFYAAPEMLKGEKYNGLNIDIWSSGIILYLMLTGLLPFNDNENNINVLYKKIIDGKFNIPNYLSKNAKNLIKKILVTNPRKRIKINDIKKHSWFNLVDTKLNFNKGIDINVNVIPIDEDIISEMEKLNFNKQEVRENILRDNHNYITTTYYLLVRKKMRKNIESVSDFKSKLYENFIDDEKNLLKNFDFNIDNVVKERSFSNNKSDKMPLNNDNDSKNNNNINNKNIIENKGENNIDILNKKTKSNKNKKEQNNNYLLKKITLYSKNNKRVNKSSYVKRKISLNKIKKVKSVSKNRNNLSLNDSNLKLNKSNGKIKENFSIKKKILTTDIEEKIKNKSSNKKNNRRVIKTNIISIHFNLNEKENNFKFQKQNNQSFDLNLMNKKNREKNPEKIKKILSKSIDEAKSKKINSNAQLIFKNKEKKNFSPINYKKSKEIHSDEKFNKTDSFKSGEGKLKFKNNKKNENKILEKKNSENKIDDKIIIKKIINNNQKINDKKHNLTDDKIEKILIKDKENNEENKGDNKKNDIKKEYNTENNIGKKIEINKNLNDNFIEKEIIKVNSTNKTEEKGGKFINKKNEEKKLKKLINLEKEIKPFDLSTLYFLQSNILKQNIIKILSSLKIKYKIEKSDFYKLICEKNDKNENLIFEIEIIQSSIQEYSIFKILRKEGNYNQFIYIQKTIQLKLNKLQ